MYPVIKGSAATGGMLTQDHTAHLLVQFNCLGVQGTKDIELVIESPYSLPLNVVFRKSCHNKSIFSVIESDIEGSSYLADFIFVLLV